MTLNTFSSGVNLNFSTELNENFTELSNKTNILQIYTGSGFDSSRTSNSEGTYEQSYELTTISADDLSGLDYIEISTTYVAKADPAADTSGSGIAYWKVQSKEVGGVYTDSVSYITVVRADRTSTTGVYSGGTISWIHTLSAGEKANGVQFKLFSKSYTGADGNSASFNNVQTVVRGA